MRFTKKKTVNDSVAGVTTIKTKQKHYNLFRSYAEYLLQEIEEDGVNYETDEMYYTTLLMGYMCGVSEAFDLDQTEVSNMHTECDLQIRRVKELINRIITEERYAEAADGIRRISSTKQGLENFEK